MAKNPDDESRGALVGKRHDKLVWLDLVKGQAAGTPGAAARALLEIVNAGDACADFDAAMCFLAAMGHAGAEKLGFAAYGGHHPLDERASVSKTRLARLFGSDPLGRVQRHQQELERDPEATLRKLAPLIAAAGACARALCAELLRAFDELACGDARAAVARRARIISRWNRMVDGYGVDEFPYPRLCTHCGRPMILVAKDSLGGGKRAPARVHPGCRNAERLAIRRSARRRKR